MKKVREGLYIGGMEDAIAVLSGYITDVTHILSVAAFNFLKDDQALDTFLAFKTRQSSLNNPDAAPAFANLELGAQARAKLVRKTVDLIDADTENMLDSLEECLEFIEKGRSEGGVLVHCVAGISRSASVITAFLMRSDKLTFKDSLSALKKCKRRVCPNAGFRKQLELFEEMGCVVDKNSSVYRRFRLENLGQKYNTGNKIDISKLLAEDPHIRAENVPKESKQRLFRCMKCRRLLAVQDNLVDHTKYGEYPEVSSCTAIFVEPMQWMTTDQRGLLPVQGKLSCAGCGAKVGNYNWAGVQCNCGIWVTPAFHFHSQKIDDYAL